MPLAGTPFASDLHLDLPYPNPGSEHIVLRYFARRAGIVTVRIHDVRGALVTELVRESTGDPTMRSVLWSTERVPAGVYFAVLEAGTHRVSRKVIVRK